MSVDETSWRLDRAPTIDATRTRPYGTAARSNLRAGLGDGAAWSVMVGIGEMYLPAFALAAGMGEIASGLVATIPLLAGSILQLVAPGALQRCGSFRRWVTICAALQGLAFLPLAVAACVGWVPGWLVFTMASLYWGAGLASGPAWNAWVSTLIPSTVRANYFARRTRFAQTGLLCGLVGGGIWLQWAATWESVLQGFALLFSLALACRLVSVGFLARHSEPVGPTVRLRKTTWAQVRTRMIGRSEGSVLLYIVAVQSAVQISGPYFNPYMLQQLEFSYWQYVVLVASAYVSRIVALPALGRFARRFGARRLLWLGGVGITPLSAAWLVSNSFGYLIALQLTVGVAWAAYELSTTLLFFEAVPEDERTSVLTTFNVANALATVGGSLVGGAALVLFGKQPATYLTLFVVSTLARAVALVLLRRVPGSTQLRGPHVIRLPAAAEHGSTPNRGGGGIAA